MRMAWGGRGWCGLLAVLCATGGARAYEPDVTFKSFVVLPATTEDAKKLPDWQLGWHYLVQERMREMPGIQVFRFEDAAELVEQFQAGKLDVTTIANRNLIAQRFGADLVIALSYKRGGDEGWEVSASLIDPTAGPKPVAEIPAASGRSPSAVVDQLVIAILKTALSEKVVGLPPYETEVTDLGEFDRLARVVTLWPYCRKADAARGQLEKALEVLTRVIRGAKLGLLYQRYTYCHIAGTKGAAWITPVMAWAQQRTQRDARSNLVYGEALAATGDDLKAADYLSKAANLSRGGLPAVCALAVLLMHTSTMRLGLAASTLA